MERVKLYCQGECCGEAVLRQEGGQTQVRASMPDPGDGLYRAALAGEGGKVLLGVMEPEGRELVVSRRLYTRDIAGLGPQRRGEAWRSFAFQRTCWQETGSPAGLFQDKFLQTRLRNVERAWWRREDGLLLLALPVAEDAPFPLEAMFCMARVEQVEGLPCAVYAFREERPVLP